MPETTIAFVIDRWRVLDGAGVPAGSVLDANPLAGGAPPGAGRVWIVRSGWNPSGDAPPVWSAGPRAAFESFAAAFARAAAHTGAVPVLWPRAGDVVSDAPGLLMFLRSGAGTGWRFLLDPFALIAGSMLANTDDHVDRLMAFAGHGAVWGVAKRVGGPALPASPAPVVEIRCDPWETA